MAMGIPCMHAALDATCDNDLPSLNCCGDDSTCCDGKCYPSTSEAVFLDNPYLVCGDPTCCDLEGPGAAAASPSGAAPEPVSDMAPVEGPGQAPALAPALAPAGEDMEDVPLGVYGDDMPLDSTNGELTGHFPGKLGYCDARIILPPSR